MSAVERACPAESPRNERLGHFPEIRDLIIVDYGCHGFTYSLAGRLRSAGKPIRYFVNGSLESPNLSSVEGWAREQPALVKIIKCRSKYGKINLRQRLRGEVEWGIRCIEALESEKPAAIVACCVPLLAAVRIQAWSKKNGIPFVYWLQDLQGRATRTLLGDKFGLAGWLAGKLACQLEKRVLQGSTTVITIAEEHAVELPAAIRSGGRYALLENWGDVDKISPFPKCNPWSVSNNLERTRNVVYAGTLGLKHDLSMFIALAKSVREDGDVKVVVVSGGQGARQLQSLVNASNITNLTVLPFQSAHQVPQLLASASVLIAPLDPSAGEFCVPSKILAYLCAGRPIVMAIAEANPAAKMIRASGAGATVPPGEIERFISAIREILNNESLQYTLGRAGRAYALRRFDLEEIASRFLKILSDANIDLENQNVSSEVGTGLSSH